MWDFLQVGGSEGHLGPCGSGVDQGGPAELGRLREEDRERRMWERKGILEETQDRNYLE